MVDVSRRWRPRLFAAVGVTTAAMLAATSWVIAAEGGWPWTDSQEVLSMVAGQEPPTITEEPTARLAVAGDTGTGTDAEYATAQAMAAQAGSSPYDGLLLLGDLIYEEGDVALVDQMVTEPFAAVLDDGARLLPVLGNHDYASGEQQQILAALGRATPWYDEDVGPLRVLVLDSNQVRDPDQTRWLRQALAEPQPPGTWTVVAMHHPAYSAGHHGSYLAVREQWGPLFAEAHVPLVLAGHDHDYQRTTPQDGVTYVVSGAGAKLRPAGREDFTAAAPRRCTTWSCSSTTTDSLAVRSTSPARSWTPSPCPADNRL